MISRYLAAGHINQLMANQSKLHSRTAEEKNVLFAPSQQKKRLLLSIKDGFISIMIQEIKLIE